MTPQLMRLEDAPAQRWRNGGGSTRELLAWPSTQAWQLRLSVADINADGPFSVFDGVQRWFVVLQGAGAMLTVDGQDHRQRRADGPLHFDGAARTHCRLLDGPTRDLNLMLRQLAGGLLPAVAGQAWQPPGQACGLFSRLPGRCHFSAAPGGLAAGQALPAMALCWFASAPASLRWQPSAPGDIATPTLPQAWWLWADTAAPPP